MENPDKYPNGHPALADAPELSQEAHPFLSAFHDLVNSRQIGMSRGPIPYSEIICWVNENGKTGDIREMYIKLIQFIDVTQLNIDHERENKKKKKK